jgi:hypothetical protein
VTAPRCQPTTGHTPLPWSIEFNEKSGRFSFLGKLGNGNVRASDGYGTMFSVEVSVLDDRDECRFPRVDPELAANVSLIFEAVNSHATLKARIAELEANERAYESILGKRTYNEVAEHIAELEGALDFLFKTKWKSIDRDNMEFEGRVTCYQLDRARAALSHAGPVARDGDTT